MKTFEYGTFDEDSGLLDVTHQSGFFSVCTVTLQMLADLDRLPKNLKIRWVKQKFWWDLPEQGECFHYFFQRFPAEEMTLKGFDLKPNGIYADIDHRIASEYIRRYFVPSVRVLERADFFRKKYQISSENTIGLYVR
jgi:hypothetical protein